jgi:RHS repeat-associated protein
VGLNIAYTYDPLGRLTGANYSDGTFFHYTYDAVGNRLSQATQVGTVNYVYDDANRLASVGGMSYTWDANGNLLLDGSSTYGYTNNKLSSITNTGENLQIFYQYNGLGARVSQTVNSVTTHYVLDQAAGLTQVLSDGTYSYLYGNGRIGQFTASESAYFLTDALGSVRQLTDASGNINFIKSYGPYGEMLSSTGSGVSIYGFDGEQTDLATGLTYLRARYYNPVLGQFQTKDTWQGNFNRPASLNWWSYVEGNPVNRVDPTGYSWGLAAFAMCFKDIMPPVIEGLGGTAEMAIATCKMAYDKNAWGLSIHSWHGKLPSTTAELFAWYLNEYGDEHLYFDAAEPLTKELATSLAIHEIRTKLYKGEDVGYDMYKFNGPEFISAILDVQSISIPITHFLGSFIYQVKKLPDGRVGFRIDNDTTLESGTHFVFRFPPEYRGSVEQLIQLQPELGKKPLEEIAKEYNVISILSPRTREMTSGSMGGGNMYQTFTWTERNDSCLANTLIRLLPRQTIETLLDMKVWFNYETETTRVYR